MKKITLILLISAFVLTGCSKPTEQLTTTTQQTQAATVSNYSYFKVLEAGETHIGFNVTVAAQPDQVKRLVLYRVPNILRYYITKPVTGSYVMYDHISLYPTGYGLPTFFYFEFEMNDGSRVTGESFEVR